MQKDFNNPKSGMKHIVEAYGSETLKKFFKNGEHNAQVDAKTLCLLSTSKRMYSRFASFTALDLRFGPRDNYNVRLLPY